MIKSFIVLAAGMALASGGYARDRAHDRAFALANPIEAATDGQVTILHEDETGPQFRVMQQQILDQECPNHGVNNAHDRAMFLNCVFERASDYAATRKFGPGVGVVKANFIWPLRAS
ncbi:MAG: hypothetical protein JWN90_65 [Parcubacteria group bacterium]|nr:hypothetical protein [Parcubacteria group bacterium]